jgi:hypothetical protein
MPFFMIAVNENEQDYSKADQKKETDRQDHKKCGIYSLGQV